MYIIADRINGMFKDVNALIEAKDAQGIQNLANELLESGATALDINAGPKTKDPQGTLLWLAETIRGVSDAALSIDVAKPDIMKAVVSQV